MTCAEVGELRQNTLDNLISFNRELKVSYSSIQAKQTQVTDETPNRLKEFSKEYKKIQFNPEALDAKMERHAQDCIN